MTTARPASRGRRRAATRAGAESSTPSRRPGRRASSRAKRPPRTPGAGRSGPPPLSARFGLQLPLISSQAETSSPCSRRSRRRCGRRGTSSSASSSTRAGRRTPGRRRGTSVQKSGSCSSRSHAFEVGGCLTEVLGDLGLHVGLRDPVQPQVRAVRVLGLAVDHPAVRPRGRALVREDRLRPAATSSSRLHEVRDHLPRGAEHRAALREGLLLLQVVVPVLADVAPSAASAARPRRRTASGRARTDR